MDPALRPEALQRLAESLHAICEAAAAQPAVGIMVEPLDVTAHKKQALGYTPEAVSLADGLRRGFEGFCGRRAGFGSSAERMTSGGR